MVANAVTLNWSISSLSRDNMMKNTLIPGLIALSIWVFSSCNVSTTADSEITDSTKIVSTNGTLSEILVTLGFEDNIVGVDVASTYPASLQQKPKIGHNREISAEGVLALNADLALG